MKICLVDRVKLISFSGRILGSIFLTPPSSKNNIQLIKLLSLSNWIDNWPIKNKELDRYSKLITESINNPKSNIDDAYLRLFIGPNKIEIPPWGSVWLDSDCVIFGNSTIELRQWMDSYHINYLSRNEIPEDHIGLLLSLSAWLSDKGDISKINELLSFHILPWAITYLKIMKDHANSEFYSAISGFTLENLILWQVGNNIPIERKKIHYSY